MKNNQVILDLETYNRLRDFHTDITGGKTIIGYDASYDDRHIFTTDEAVKLLMTENDALDSKVIELNHKIWMLENPGVLSKKSTLNDVKDMSVREFRKWRKK